MNKTYRIDGNSLVVETRTALACVDSWLGVYAGVHLLRSGRVWIAARYYRNEDGSRTYQALNRTTSKAEAVEMFRELVRISEKADVETELRRAAAAAKAAAE